MPSLDVIVVGNVAFDILCYPVNDVPRHGSITFQKAAIGPGGCGSNTAIGLAALGIKTALLACIGEDLGGEQALRSWKSFGVSTEYIKQQAEIDTGVSVGLIDAQAQPRFVHTTGANSHLGIGDLPVENLLSKGIRLLHLAGYFLLPGLLNDQLGPILAVLRENNVKITLDVQQTPRMTHPESLFSILPELDVFICNLQEAQQMLGAGNEYELSDKFHTKGARVVILKLGERGCLLSDRYQKQLIPPPKVNVVDTTGAGDAFAAGLIASLIREDNLLSACHRANLAGAKAVTRFGAIAIWENLTPDELAEILA